MADRDAKARSERARGRALWPGAVTRLEELPEQELVEGTPEELVGMVRDLTLAAWAMSRRPIPDYDRANAPGRVLRPSNDR